MFSANRKGGGGETPPLRLLSINSRIYSAIIIVRPFYSLNYFYYQDVFKGGGFTNLHDNHIPLYSPALSSSLRHPPQTIPFFVALYNNL